MKLISFKKDGNKAVATFSIDVSEFDCKVEEVWHRQKRWFKVPGFRSGKVPRGIIENEYGRDIFYDSALELLYPKMVDLILEETKEKIITIEGELYMQMSPDSKPKILDKNEDSVETKVEVNIYPSVDIDYNNIEVEVEPKREASEEEVEAQMFAAQRRMGTKHMDAQTRVQENDFVRLDIDSLVPLKEDGNVDEEDKTFSKFKNLRNFKLKVGSGQISAIEEALKGHTAAEGVFQTDVEFPKELENKDIAGKKVKASLKILALKRLYEMSEVAKNKGFDNLDDFINSLKEKINKHYESVYENEKKRSLVDTLVDKISDELVSEDMISGKVALVKSEYKKIAESMGQNLENVIESFGGEEEFNNKVRYMVKVDLKGLIAFHSIAEKEGIKFSDEEIEAYKNKLKSQGLPFDNSSKAVIIDRMLSEKVIEFMMSKAKFVDKVHEDDVDSDSENSELDTDRESSNDEQE